MSDDLRYHTSRWRKLREQVLRDEPLCHYCEAKGIHTLATTVDHVVPVARGGDFWERENLCGACLSCNSSKADTPVELWLGCSEDGTGLFWDQLPMQDAGRGKSNQSSSPNRWWHFHIRETQNPRRVTTCPRQLI